MAQVQEEKNEHSKLSSYEDYFERIQSKKKLPKSLQEALTSSFANIPVSSFPGVPGGKVIEIEADTSVIDAVRILSECNILSAPVKTPNSKPATEWRDRYLGTVDYYAVVQWVLDSAELAAATLSAGAATAAGVGAGALGAVGAAALGATGPVAVAGIAAAAVGAAVAGGVVAEKGPGKDAATAADSLGDDFYKVLLREEPFKSTTVRSIVKSYRWAPFVPVATDSSMLTVLLLLSKYRLRNVPVVEPGRPEIANFITQSAVVHGLDTCRGRDWFDCIAALPLSQLGLPFMMPHEVISVGRDELALEAFKKMMEHQIGGLPVVEGPEKKMVGNLSIRDIGFLLLKPDLFSNFGTLTVGKFVDTVASAAMETGRKSRRTITCKVDSSLGSVIHKLASESVHRIYVVAEEESRVIGVVTLRDVISCFVYEPPNHFDSYFGFSMKEMLNQ